MLSLDQLHAGLRSGAFHAELEKIYGGDAPKQAARLAGVAARFAEHFPARDIAVFSAPGRSEIGGNHTDHNRGKVLAASVSLDNLAVAAKTDEARVRVKSAGYNMNDVDLADLAPVASETGHSNAMVRGICAGFAQRGYAVGGFEAATASDVLGGSGLSSSAAFAVLVGTILSEFYNGGGIPPLEIARIAQYAENEFVGKPCGLMDQTACAVGGFVAIDFKDAARPAVRKVEFDFAASGHALCVVNTGGSHADLTGDYAAVRGEMEAVARALGREVLREASKQALLENLPNVRKACGDRAVLRALHFFAENDRVDAQAEALERGDFGAFLSLVKESGRSSFMYNQNVYNGKPAGRQPVSLALALSETLLGGRGAWRVHGGGFAGTIQAFVPLDLLGEYRAAMEGAFGAGACYVLKVRPFGALRVL
jgi:galactokinase